MDRPYTANYTLTVCTALGLFIDITIAQHSVQMRMKQPLDLLAVVLQSQPAVAALGSTYMH